MSVCGVGGTAVGTGINTYVGFVAPCSVSVCGVGGTAVGTGINTYVGFAEKVAVKVAEFTG